MTGIYTITSKINNKIYVGCALNIDKRKDYHFRRLLFNKHANRHLHNTYNKYGKENLIFEILIECESEFLASEEHYWATILNTHNLDYGFNIRPTNPYNYNKRISPETAKLIGLKNKGKKHTPEMIKYMSESKKGKSCHPNTRKACIENKNRYKFSEADKKAAEKSHYKPILQFDIFGRFIKRWDSVVVACSRLKLKRQQIYACANNKALTAYGYIWIYE